MFYPRAGSDSTPSLRSCAGLALLGFLLLFPCLLPAATLVVTVSDGSGPAIVLTVPSGNSSNSDTLQATVTGSDGGTLASGNLGAFGASGLFNSAAALSFANTGTITALDNAGDPSSGNGAGLVNGNGNVGAFGVYLFDSGAGALTLSNSGTISATDAGSGSGGGQGGGGGFVFDNGNIGAFGLYAQGSGNGALTLSNSGNITATDSGSGGNTFGAVGGGGGFVGDNGNTGNIDNVGAFGLYAESDGGGAITVNNSGAIIVIDSGSGGNTGGGGNGGGGGFVFNNGNIGAFGLYAQGSGNGALTLADSGSIIVTDSGSGGNTGGGGSGGGGGLVSGNGNVGAFGLYAQGSGNGSFTLTNTGSITATDSGSSGNTVGGGYGGGGGYVNGNGNVGAFGLYAQGSGNGSLTLFNGGSITATDSGSGGNTGGGNGGGGGYVGNGSNSGNIGAFGLYAESDGGGIITVSNSGTLTATDSGSGGNTNGGLGGGGGLVSGNGNVGAFGLYAQGSGNGALTLVNSGTLTAIDAGTDGDTGTGGIGGSGGGGGFVLGNGNVGAFGLYAQGTGNGALALFNSGSITATDSGSGGNTGGGIGGGGGYVDSNGNVGAFGLYAESDGGGAITASNSGTITVSTSAGGFTNSGLVGAYGIYAQSSGAIAVSNTGTINAPGQTGIYLANPGTVFNSGAITAATAISAFNGSTVTLGGLSPITGTLIGGTTGVGSTLNLDFTGVSPTAAAAIEAAIAGQTSASFTLHGRTYTYANFSTVTTDFTSFASAGPLGTLFDNYSGANPSSSLLTLYNNLGNLPASQLPQAFSELTPLAVSQQIATTAVTTSLFQNLLLGNRLQQVHSGLAGGFDPSGLQVLASGDPLLGSIAGRLYAYNPPSGETLSDAQPAVSMAPEEQFNRWGTFLTGNAILTSQGAHAGQSSADSTTIDLLAGADYRIDRNWTAGFLFGYARTAADLDAYGSRADADSYRFGPYASYASGPWYVNGQATVGFNQETADRAVPIAGTVAEGHPDSTQYGAAFDGGYDFKAGKLTYGPIAGVQYTHLDVGSYNESGGGVADLDVASQSVDSLQTQLGAKAGYDLFWKWNGAVVRPEVRASWLHECLDTDRGVTAQFQEPGLGSFVTQTGAPQRDSALLGGGITNTFPGGSLLFLDYDAQVGQSDFSAQSITGGFKILF